MAVDRPRGQFLGDQLHFYQPAQATSIENGTSGSIGPTAGPVPKQSTSKIYLRQNDQSETR